jgi:hypothetical protein
MPYWVMYFQHYLYVSRYFIGHNADLTGATQLTVVTVAVVGVCDDSYGWVGLF